MESNEYRNVVMELGDFEDPFCDLEGEEAWAWATEEEDNLPV